MAGTRLFSLLSLAALAAGSGAGSALPLRGRIVDQTRSAIVGARVSAAGVDTASDDQGAFLLALPGGELTLEITANGFLPVSRKLQLPESGLDLGEIVLTIEPVRDGLTVTESPAYQVDAVRSGAKTLTPLRDLPQSVSVVTSELVKDQMMLSIGDIARYVPGVTAIQGENNRDQVVIRGNSSSADFFLNGVRDDVQYYRDLYNLEDVEALKGPNAMAFGRGGGGGVINRVTKEAGFTPLHEISILGGSFGEKRVAADFNEVLSSRVALRFNGMAEDAGTFRQYGGLRRFAFNPTVTVAASARTRLTFSYEHLRDDRVADRGIPSFQGRPVDVDPSTYFGDPDNSHAGARVNIGSATLEQQFGRLTLRNRTLVGDYDRGYQNFVPGAVSADRSTFALSAYNNATRRRNVFNQTDLTYGASIAGLRHTITAGMEAGSQGTENFKNTGYFNDRTTSIVAPFAAPAVRTPITFRQSATDADNDVRALVGATYLQDQVQLPWRLEAIAGIRFDHFDLRYRNHRNGDNLRRIDNVASPRAGLVFKPLAAVSLYANYSISFLPSAGDQFSSLTSVTQQVKPEKFSNYEAGAKWDVSRRLALTAAVYRLDRTNTRSVDPNDPTRIVQTGSQRTKGVELGWNGNITRAWQVAGGYAFQDAFVTSATASVRAGAVVAQVPRHTFSFWNRYQLRPRVGVGLGLLNRSEMFAAIDDSVVLRGYVRADGAVYYSLTERIRLQANFENLLDRRYILNADGNNNISPGSPRAVRIGMTARF
jgi:catecholate siderophore receptor